jgi:hypothetical protein
MQARSGAYLFSIFLLSGLSGCEDQCSSFSPNKFNCQQIADASYNVHFNLPDETEISLGQTAGLSNCAARASEYAKQYSVPKQYYCCLITATSSCAEKHR